MGRKVCLACCGSLGSTALAPHHVLNSLGSTALAWLNSLGSTSMQCQGEPGHVGKFLGHFADMLAGVQERSPVLVC